VSPTTFFVLNDWIIFKNKVNLSQKETTVRFYGISVQKIHVYKNRDKLCIRLNKTAVESNSNDLLSVYHIFNFASQTSQFSSFHKLTNFTILG
jgi:hypothetical protein